LTGLSILNAFRKLIAAEVPRWRKVVQGNGIKADN
jgi:hypothetical protein